MRFLHPSPLCTEVPPERLRPRSINSWPRALNIILLLVLPAFVAPAAAQTINRFDSSEAAIPAADSSPVTQSRKRLVKLRSDDATRGSRFTLAADSSLGDYKTYAEGDHFFVLLPRSALASAPSSLGGHGFSDLRVFERGDDLVLSFHLQQGASFSVNQKFNRLDVAFNTNEE